MPDIMNQYPIDGGSRADKPMFADSTELCACTCNCTKDTEDRSYVLCPPCMTGHRVGDGKHGVK